MPSNALYKYVSRYNQVVPRYRRGIYRPFSVALSAMGAKLAYSAYQRALKYMSNRGLKMQDYSQKNTRQVSNYKPRRFIPNKRYTTKRGFYATYP